MICRSVKTWTGSSNIICAGRHKFMRVISDSRHLEVPGTCAGESVLGTCVGELRGDGGGWYMVRIEWTGRLAFGK